MAKTNSSRTYLWQMMPPCWFLLIVGIVFFPGLAWSQSYIGPKNIGMGSGGTAYLNGPEAGLINPANLMIYDRPGTIKVTFAETASFFQPVLSSNNAREQWQNFRNQYLPHQPGSQQISNEKRSLLLEENYPRSRLLSQHQSRSEVLLGGVSWLRDHSAYSLALRSRTATRIEVGRGWYSAEFFESGNEEVRDFTLTAQRQTLHEISFSYARELEFFNGLFANLNRLYIGFAPKLVIGGSFSNSKFEAQTTNGQSPELRSRFSHRSTADYSDMIQHYRQNRQADQAIDQHLESSFLVDPTGYGGAVDFGLNYVIPLQSNAAILDTGSDRRTLGQSLRFALSITDLGVIRYNSNPMRLENSADTTQSNFQESINSTFIGAPGQYLSFFENAPTIEHPYLNAESISENSFWELLPTSINGGFFLDLNRIKFSGDLTVAVHNTAFKSTRLAAHFGTELYPHPNIPLRAGTQLSARQPVHFSFGTGYEQDRWELYISGQALVKSTLNTELTGGGAAGLRFHF